MASLQRTKLRVLMDEKGVSASGLAELTGLSRNMINKYANAAKDINRAAAVTVMTIAAALDVSAEAILECESQQ